MQQDTLTFFAARDYNTQKLQNIANDIAKWTENNTSAINQEKSAKYSTYLKICSLGGILTEILKLGFILNKHKEILTGSELLS